jgi:hypothetical protein
MAKIDNRDGVVIGDEPQAYPPYAVFIDGWRNGEGLGSLREGILELDIKDPLVLGRTRVC